MDEKLSVCGYRCDLCTLHEENVKRLGKQVAIDGFKKYYDHKIDFTNWEGCKGCPEDGDEKCMVKVCAKQKGKANCGLCESFPCEQLKERMGVIEKYFKDLSALPQRERELFAEPYDNDRRLGEIHKEQGK